MRIDASRQRDNRNIAIALALSVFVHGAFLSWRAPRIPNRFGAQLGAQPALEATLTRRTPAPEGRLIERRKPQPPAPPIETVPPLASPKAKTKVPPAVPIRRQSRKPKRAEPALQAPESEPTQIAITDRDASIPEDNLQELRNMVKGQGRIRFQLYVNRAGRIEEVTVETTEIPAELELAVTRKLFSTAFLPAYRTGAPAGSPLTLELEP